MFGFMVFGKIGNEESECEKYRGIFCHHRSGIIPIASSTLNLKRR